MKTKARRNRLAADLPQGREGMAWFQGRWVPEGELSDVCFAGMRQSVDMRQYRDEGETGVIGEDMRKNTKSSLYSWRDRRLMYLETCNGD